MRIDEKYNDYYIAILILSLIFYIISKRDIKILLSIIIIIIIGYYLYEYINNKNKIINNDIKGRKDVNDNNFIIKNFPKTIKYLIKDNNIVDILLNIRFIKKYDCAKYTDLINYLDKFMKVYIFILSDRYNIEDYFETLIDLRYIILKDMYSMFLIIPKDLKYTYKLNTYEELYKSINDFNLYSKKLINTIERYGRIEKKVYYLEDNYNRPYNSTTKYLLP